ncbi:MAG: hypothetical protein JSW51_13695 [Gemmatimonadota bacterium]|nr:MAG: hypothetical protein JSW51_13695 [Gemmatimonadota bacterium]
MALVTEVVPLQTTLPRAEFRWDFDTEILSGKLLGGDTAPKSEGVIEMGGPGGSFVSLGLAGPTMIGLEVVVWPESRSVAELVPPASTQQGQLYIYPDAQERTTGVVELKVPLGCEQSSDKSIIHIVVGDSRTVESITVADNLLAEVDGQGHLAGFWLIDVPPFPEAGPHR